METLVVDIHEDMVEAGKTCVSIGNAIEARSLNPQDWIDRHASGTLRKNARLSFSWSSQYRVERVAWEFGWGFEMLPKTRVTFNTPITYGDCRAVTESGWHIERCIERNMWMNDQYEAKYIIVEGGGGKGEAKGRREGVGLLLKKTSAVWLPRGYIVFAIIAEYDYNTHEWGDPINPF